MTLATFESAGARTLTLAHALLVYKAESGSSETLVTLHDVQHQDGAAPVLGAGRAPTYQFAQGLARKLLGTSPLYMLPASLVACGQDTVAWWTPAQKRTLAFQTRSPEVDALSGRAFACPPLLFHATGRWLCVRTLLADARPEADDQLAAAPFPNVEGASGQVCLGSAAPPAVTSPETIAAWEACFFDSYFTHSHGQLATKHPGGITALILEWAEASAFPSEHLTRVKQTVGQFLRGRTEP